MSDIVFKMGQFIKSNDAIIAGVPLGGISYATLIAYLKRLPMIMIRSEQKEYGTLKQIEGELFDLTKEVILIEDVITTGQSVRETIEILTKYGLKVKQIICILDREAGGVETLRQMGYEVNSLFELKDIMTYVPIQRKLIIQNKFQRSLYEICQSKKTNICASLDLTNPIELLNILNIIGDMICSVKLHFDIINFTYQMPLELFVSKLKALKETKNFMVIEDRKFADIPYIVSKQFDKLSDCIDMITTHGICGKTLLDILDKKNVGIILIHSMSVQNNLIDKVYSMNVLDIGKNYENVVGYVTQEGFVSSHFIFSPGIALSEQSSSTDNMGQVYRPVESVKADIYIVGRSLYESKNILQTMKAFQEIGYEQSKLNI
jgi:orotidine 5'-phosphate decarboxylase subfamily 1/orotate phosphoribosyltransferase